MAGGVFFEESGGLKLGLVISSAAGSEQVSLSTGRRVKVKANQVLARFEVQDESQLEPFLQQAQSVADELDPDFLWQCAPSDVFTADAFAPEVFGQQVSPKELVGLILSLHQAPMYFYRKGKGQFKSAPPEALQAALAGAAKRAALAEQEQAFTRALLDGQCPDEIAQQAMTLLIKPDKQSVAFKALSAAAHQSQVTPAALLMRLGVVESAYALHLSRFMAECFPGGHEHAPQDESLTRLQDRLAALSQSLPRAPMGAYSIDDEATTEVDDAFSCETLDHGGWRVGIHIAAPGALLAPDDPLAQLARDRASTVYFPGDKITMLPAQVIALASLDEADWRPAVSLYVEFDANGERLSHATRFEMVQIHRNIRHGDWEADLSLAVDPSAAPEARALARSRLPWSDLTVLHHLALACRARREAVRGRPEPAARLDYGIRLTWQDHPRATALALADVEIQTRQRGSALDLLVSEFMILTNVTWGETLALGQLPGVYRCQSMGRVRMQTTPGPHQGLGVSHYAWSTSPLRRYSDLVNQWQLLSILGHGRPAFKGGDANLFADVAHFDAVYDRYAEFQSSMERYWTGRWFGQQLGLSGEAWQTAQVSPANTMLAVATRTESVVRLRAAPAVLRLALSSLPAGTELEVAVTGFDPLDIALQGKVIRIMQTDSVGRYAVLGDPIAHSKSPFIHRAFAEQTGLAMDYEAIAVPPEELTQRLAQLHEQGYAGLNLTVPHKHLAYDLALSEQWPLSTLASQAGAVNTLIRTDQGWQADNTDGLGLLTDLLRSLEQSDLSGLRLLIIGAGGAAAGVLGPLAAAGLAAVTVVNRTPEKAQVLADRFSVAYPTVSWQADGLQSLAPGASRCDQAFDLVINASSASLQGQALEIAPGIFSQARLVVDMMYGAQPTAFMQQASHAGASLVTDGLGMLVEQAAEAFERWQGQRPQTLPVLQACRQALIEAAAGVE
ncbi:MAG: shikimate dehydrogenase [Burkholderiaceae bacterium]